MIRTVAGEDDAMCVWKEIDGKWYLYKANDEPWQYLCYEVIPAEEDFEGGTAWLIGKGGLMYTGWVDDVSDPDDPNCPYFYTFYADPESGVLARGWREIDGKWYYFNQIFHYMDSNGVYYGLGQMLYDTTTPDGYVVGADGAWIQ